MVHAGLKRCPVVASQAFPNRIFMAGKPGFLRYIRPLGRYQPGLVLATILAGSISSNSNARHGCGIHEATGKCFCKAAGKGKSAVPDYSEFQPIRGRSNPKQIAHSPSKYSATQHVVYTLSAWGRVSGHWQVFELINQYHRIQPHVHPRG